MQLEHHIHLIGDRTELHHPGLLAGAVVRHYGIHDRRDFRTGSLDERPHAVDVDTQVRGVTTGRVCGADVRLTEPAAAVRGSQARSDEDSAEDNTAEPVTTDSRAKVCAAQRMLRSQRTDSVCSWKPPAAVSRPLTRLVRADTVSMS
jgi:hypothetical protein